MKKSLLIVVAVLSTFSILAVDYFNENPKVTSGDRCSLKKSDTSTLIEQDPEFHYAIGNRFSNTITLEALLEAKIVDDLIAADAMNSVVSMWEVKLMVLSNKKDKIEKGEDRALTDAQLGILQSLDYNSDCNITALCTLKNVQSGQLTEGYFDDYFTVIPEKEARYNGGENAVIDYLVSKSSELTKKVDQDQLKAGMIRFVVTKEGAITHVSLDTSCGYRSIDKALINLVKEMPQKWTPAENATGEKVDQELVLFYGLVGC
ncbi:MAG: hypothetical protein Crog4KO_17010 [Crocinitomicaceae bacterium]